MHLGITSEKVVTLDVFKCATPTNINISYKPCGLKWKARDVVTTPQLQCMTMASTPVSELSDGPVLSVINKRLCALRKKHNRIFQMEESRMKGKTLNKEQKETLRSKSVVITAIDELEKLRHPLAAVVVEEFLLAPC
ncbi:hypothetical protein H5410_001243 [Solanum commersonii]|uniref:Uncharacterized protein n=1 Tax=Solanum commersonii TaxID=4109 RepID=A0A9J6AYD3_SOLCO|nr:hypothetical protein H5410_001243 [Solanum commersonii]